MAGKSRIATAGSIIFMTALSLVGVFLLWGCTNEPDQLPNQPPPDVTVEKVVLRTVPVHLNYVATTVSVKVVDIRARVEGFLEERRFVEGADVKKGDLIFVIEKAPYEAELEKGLARLAQDRAALSFAQDQVTRYRPLAEQGFVTQETLEDYETRAREAAAAVQADLAKIKQDRLNLGYCTMYSPLNGRIGRTLVNVGNLVGADEDTKLATIVQLDPMYVYFSPSEKDLGLILKHRPEKNIPVDIILSDGSTYAYPGKVDFIDNRADPAANTINMRAVIPNPEKKLLPGIYVQARLFLCEVPDTPLITEKAISEDQSGMYVYVVGKDNRVEKRSVQIGFLYDHRKIVWKGLKEGELVITDGLQLVRPGMAVRAREVEAGNREETDETGLPADDKQPASTADPGRSTAATPMDGEKETRGPCTSKE